MSVFDKIRRLKEKNNTWQKTISRFVCSFVLILNFILLALWFAPDHIRHPVSKKIHSLLPGAAQEHVAARAGVNIHEKFSSPGKGKFTEDEASMIMQQNEDRDILMNSGGECDGEKLLLLLRSPSPASTNELDVEHRLSQFGFQTLLQTCSNFEQVREDRTLVLGRIATPGLFRCQFLLNSKNYARKNSNRGIARAPSSAPSPASVSDQEAAVSLLDNHGDCWCAKKFRQHHIANNGQHTLRDLKRFSNTYSTYLSLNGTITVHLERMVRVTGPPYCAEDELARILDRYSSLFSSSASLRTVNASSSSSSTDASERQVQERHPPVAAQALSSSTSSLSSPSSSPSQSSIVTITNATLRDVLKDVTKIQLRLRKRGLHISKNTPIVPTAKSKSGNDVTVAEAFVHLVASQLHHNFEGKKVLVWSSRKLPTVEVTMYALSGAKHVDAVATQSYKTTVPAMTVFTPPEFVAKLTEFEYYALLEQERNAKQELKSENQKPLRKHAYGAIVSYLTLQELGLGRFGETIDPFADLHAMNEFWHLLQPGGTLVLVIPVGADCLDFNQQRVYGRTRLAVLLRGWTVDFSVGVTEKTMSPSAGNQACDPNSISDAIIVLRRSSVKWSDRESVEADGIGRIPGLL